jgi:hypothetical protein
MDKQIVKILEKYGCAFMQTDNKEMLEEIESLVINKNVPVSSCCGGASEKKVKDLINWVKSDLAQETGSKLSKTATPYRSEKIKFLNKLLKI